MQRIVAITVCAAAVLLLIVLVRRRPPATAVDRPELKQFADLTASDFDRHPVWIGVHTADYDEPWYDETEETFRPRTGPLPARLSEGMLLVRASIRLPDGLVLPGFATPAETAGDLGTMQPQVFVAGRRFAFWHGLVGPDLSERQALYAALDRPPDHVFPLTFQAAPGLTSDSCEGEIDGFLSIPGDRVVAER